MTPRTSQRDPKRTRGGKHRASWAAKFGVRGGMFTCRVAYGRRGVAPTIVRLRDYPSRAQLQLPKHSSARSGRRRTSSHLGGGRETRCERHRRLCGTPHVVKKLRPAAVPTCGLPHGLAPYLRLAAYVAPHAPLLCSHLGPLQVRAQVLVNTILPAADYGGAGARVYRTLSLPGDGGVRRIST